MPPSNPSSGAVSPVASKLLELAERAFALATPEQRAFMLRMKPTREKQELTSADYDAIDCHVNLPQGFDDVTWFGGMRWDFSACADEGSFQFNELGIALRALAAQATEVAS